MTINSTLYPEQSPWLGQFLPTMELVSSLLVSSLSVERALQHHKFSLIVRGRTIILKL